MFAYYSFAAYGQLVGRRLQQREKPYMFVTDLKPLLSLMEHDPVKGVTLRVRICASHAPSVRERLGAVSRMTELNAGVE